MDYADSGNLRNYLERNHNNLSWNDKYNLAFQLTDAVSYLHEEGIIHRDLVIMLNDYIGISNKYTLLIDFT